MGLTEGLEVYILRDSDPYILVVGGSRMIISREIIELGDKYEHCNSNPQV